MRIEAAAGQRHRRVARIVRLQRVQHDEVAAARRAHAADHVGPCAKPARLGFEPAHAVIYVGHRARIGRIRRIAEIERGDDDAAPRDRHVDRVVIGAVAFAPCAAMRLDHRRKRSRTARLEDAGEERLVAMPQVFDLLDIDLVLLVHGASIGVWRCGQLSVAGLRYATVPHGGRTRRWR
jgi:hypothetical protein